MFTRIGWIAAMAVATALGHAHGQDEKKPPPEKSAGGRSSPRHAPPPSSASRPGQEKIVTQDLSLTQGEAKVACFLARPAGDQPAPGLLLIHEWWGLNDWVKGQAKRFAEQGYVALAVDLYRGETATDAEHAHELMRGLTDERALADMKLAFGFLSGHRATRGQRVGVMGWCMGGGFALKLAIAEPSVACTVMCYGRPVTDIEQLRRIKGPLLGVWGGNDRGIEVEPFRKALEEAKVRATHHVYPGAGHAFLNETNQRGYNPEQASKATKEIDRFLAQNLRKP